MPTNTDIDTVVYLLVAEEWWDKPYVKKRHHLTTYRTVVLKGTVVDERGNQIKVKLEENNGFERDGGTYVFGKGNLLVNQKYPADELGIWKYPKG
jgi:hypothetical protein